MTTATKHAYSGADVEQLNWSRAVRANPGMYVGDAREHGLHHILWEIISNSIDEVVGSEMQSAGGFVRASSAFGGVNMTLHRPTSSNWPHGISFKS